jgi:hypothetical protein
MAHDLAAGGVPARRTSTHVVGGGDEVTLVVQWRQIWAAVDLAPHQ